jgi:4-amino-4-deoxy-L-arabinose transferase-like glycosyltransferase
LPLFSSAAASLRASTLTQRLWALLAFGLLLHLVFGSLLTLSVDEAHYALYADKLALSYFDHPPLVGWVQWPLVALGVPDGVLRLIPQLLWLAACLIARDLTHQLPRVVPAWQTDPHDKEVAGLWAVALVLLAPLLHVLGVGLLPDTLLMVLSLLLMQVALKLSATPQTAHTSQTRLRLWLSAGVLLGLAGLSKYTAILPAAALILTLSSTQGLRWLLSPSPWLALVIACCLVSPVFYWNAQHEWVSFVYQLNHGSGGQWRARRLLAFVGLQLVVYGPLLFLGGYLALRQLAGSRNWPALGLLSFFLLPFLVTAVLSGGGSLPHWTGPAWLALVPFAAHSLAAYWRSGKHQWIIAFVRTQTIICLLAFVALFFVGIPGISQQHAWGKKNPLADMWGWDVAGARARELARDLQIPSISVKNWTLASRMAWYARPLDIFVLDSRFDQFDLWFGQIPTGQDSIFVNWSQMSFNLPTQAGGFESCTRVEQLNIERLGRVVSDFSFYHCRHWGGAQAPTHSGKPN